MANPELEITGDLSDALVWVLGVVPSAVDAVLVVAACLDRLAKGYGLSESGHLDWDPLEHADLPEPAATLIHQLFAGDAAELSADDLRDGLYDTLVQLADDRDARKTLNTNKPLTDLGLLHVGQIYWNLESRGARTRLPIQPGPISSGSKPGTTPIHADIRVPRLNLDFATMTWTARCIQRGTYKSSGQSFRKQGARLAVLVAQRVVAAASQPLPDLEGAVLHHTSADPGPSRVSSITWPDEIPTPAAPTLAPHRDTADVAEAPLPAVWTGSPADQHADLSSGRALVGAPAPVGTDYQRRRFDTEIEQLWADGGDRRVWLRGGPGVGKSYTARRVMEQVLSDQASDREVLLVWVDSADPDSVSTAFAEAMDQLGHLGVVGRTASNAAEIQRANALLGLLATSAWRWLIVLDNADARALLDAGLVPTGANPNGRVLATTRSRDPRIASHGHAVRAGLFTAEEAQAYLRGDDHATGPSRDPLSLASQADIAALAAAVDHHPLALSVAASTITANAMTVTDWIEEFTATEVMDAAADEPDRGGYPHRIGATWQVALDRASRGLPEGTVERAAMVAAVQDPDGHPTWLWDRDAVTSWVGGGATLARHHGVPVAVQRLIDHGIVDLRGHAWKDGQVTIHQLAARAIRERAAPASLAELAGILTEQWLLELTANPEAARPDVLHRSLRPIRALPSLSTPIRMMATALLAYRQPSQVFGFERMYARSLEPYLEVGGVSVRIPLARGLVEFGDKEAALGRVDRAEAEYLKAADLYRQLVNDASLTDDERASCLKGLGDIEAHLGDPDQAQAHRQRAAGLLERLTDPAADTDVDARIRRLTDLITAYDLLGDSAGKDRAAERAEELLTHAPDDLPDDADDYDLKEQGGTWQTLGGLMLQTGRFDAVKDCLTRAAATYERLSDDSLGIRWQRVVLALALLHAGEEEWVDAERHLTRITDPQQTPWPDSLNEHSLDDDGGWRYPSEEQRDALVLLASVQNHLGRRDEADHRLASAAREYREPSSHEGLDRHDRADARDEEMNALLLKFRLDDFAANAVQSGRWGEAQRLFGALLDFAQQDADAAPGDTKEEAALGWLMARRALASHNLGLHEEAEFDLRQAAGIYQTLAELDPTDATAHDRLAMILSELAVIFFIAGRNEAHAEAMARAVSARRSLAALAPDNWGIAARLAQSLQMLAFAAEREGDHTSAVGYREEAIGILSTLVVQAPHDHPTQIALADALLHLGLGLLINGDREAAALQLRRAVDVLAPLAHTANGTLRTLADAQLHLAWALQGHPQEALAHATESVTYYRLLAEHAPDDLEIQKNLATSLMLLGSVLADIGQPAQAADHLTGAANILQLVVDLDPEERPEMLIATLNGLERIQRELGKSDEADQTLARATDLQHRQPEDDEDE